MMMMTGQFRGKVLADIRKQERRRKEEQREAFSRRYDKVKTYTFQSWDEVNTDKFVVLPKNLFDYGLSKAALAVYPVLCSRADFEEDRRFQIARKNIAFLAGVSEDTVRTATEELVAAGLLTQEMVQDGRRRFYVYRVAFIRRHMLKEPEHKGNRVYFHTCIIDSGMWADLKPRAKALYLAMRVSAKQDQDLYAEIEDAFYEPMEYDEYIRNRWWDVCSVSVTELCRMANIAPKGIGSVLDELEHHRLRLIERIGQWTKVYLRPRTGLLP